MTEEEEKPDVETAFIVYKTFDGSFHSTQTLDIAFLVDRLATRNDMHQAFRELLDTLQAEKLADVIFDKINNKSDEEGQRKTAAIRQTLLNRDIL